MNDRSDIRCQRDGLGHLVVQVIGALTEAEAMELAETVQRELGNGRCETVLFDLRKLTHCELLGRARLCDLQVVLKTKVRRTAYVTATPRFRGMTHIIIHTAEDENAGTFVTREQADEWLAARESRAVKHARVVGSAR